MMANSSGLWTSQIICGVLYPMERLAVGPLVFLAWIFWDILVILETASTRIVLIWVTVWKREGENIRSLISVPIMTAGGVIAAALQANSADDNPSSLGSVFFCYRVIVSVCLPKIVPRVPWPKLAVARLVKWLCTFNIAPAASWPQLVCNGTQTR